MTARSPAPGPIPPAPTDEESIRDEVERFRDMSPEERFEWFCRLQRSMDALVRLRGDEPPTEDPQDRDFWRRWRDPLHGRPR